MRFLLLIAVIAFANAQEYRDALKAGQRHFTSEGLKQGSGLKYDIKFVERFHSLDQEGDVFSILCTEDSVLIHANEPLDWQVGDVFAGDERWQCGDGVSRIIDEITFRKIVDGKYEYYMKTHDAELEDVFEYADITFENPESEEEFLENARLHAAGMVDEALNLKSAAKEFSKTFNMVNKEITLVSNKYITSKIKAKIDVPVYFSGFDCKIKIFSKKKSYFKTSASIGIIAEFRWQTDFYVSYEKDFRKDLWKYDRFKISIVAGPIVLTFKITPKIFVGCEVKFNAQGQLVLEYKKHFEAGIKVDTTASKRVTSYATDKTAGAKPTLTGSGSVNGQLAPYAGLGIELGAGIWGITVIKGTPELILKLVGSLSTTTLSLQPKLIFGFSLKVLFWKIVDTEATLWSGPTWSLEFDYKAPSSNTGSSTGGSSGTSTGTSTGGGGGSGRLPDVDTDRRLLDEKPMVEHYRYVVDDLAPLRR